MAAVLDPWLISGTSTYSEAFSFPPTRISRGEGPDLIGEALASVADSAAINVAARTREVAKELVRLLTEIPDPEVTVEPAGQISLEWYKDRHHVAVLTVDGPNVRWAAKLAPGAPAISGVEPFSGQVPTDALQAIRAAI